MTKTLAKSLLDDTLSRFGIPTATIQSIYEKVMERRRKEALEILLSEIRQGNFNNTDQHEVVSVIERYLRDAMEGVAKQNLRLLAKIIRGMADDDMLKAPTFLRYASVLSSLTKDELKLLGIMIRNNKNCYESAKNNIYSHFSEGQAIQILQCLLRTGLVFFAQGLDIKNNQREAKVLNINDKNAIDGDFWTNYELTTLMKEITKYTKFFSNEDLKN